MYPRLRQQQASKALQVNWGSTENADPVSSINSIAWGWFPDVEETLAVHRIASATYFRELLSTFRTLECDRASSFVCWLDWELQNTFTKCPSFYMLASHVFYRISSEMCGLCSSEMSLLCVFWNVIIFLRLCFQPHLLFMWCEQCLKSLDLMLLCLPSPIPFG